MRGLFLPALLLGVGQVTLSCITVDVLGDVTPPAEVLVDGVRHEGNLYNPEIPGCNRIPCGSFLNDEPAEKRITVSAAEASDGLKIRGTLHKLWRGGHVTFELKYGNKPEFSITPGFQLGDINIASDSDIRALYQTIHPDPGYNFNATIQVKYTTDGLVREAIPGSDVEPSDETLAVFYQCIDIEVVDGVPLPTGIALDNFGPFEETVANKGGPDLGNKGQDRQTTAGNSAFIIIAVILALLVALGIGLAIYLYSTKGERDFSPLLNDRTEAASNFEPVRHEEPSKEQTPPQEPASRSDSNPIVQLADADPVPPLEATGSQGRHFHFRYVSEDSG